MSGLRIAMWAGPSHAAGLLLRAWGNRPDTAVWDEALQQVGDGSGVQEPHAALERLRGPVPGGKAVLYENRTVGHRLEALEPACIEGVLSCFLICDPRWLLQEQAGWGFKAKTAEAGMARQVELFNLSCETSGKTPPVLDADDLFENPRAMLTRLCEAVGVSFSESMLSWASGPRDTDAPSNSALYAALRRSTGFDGIRPTPATLGGELMTHYLACQDPYRYLYKQRLRPSVPRA